MVVLLRVVVVATPPLTARGMAAPRISRRPRCCCLDGHPRSSSSSSSSNNSDGNKSATTVLSALHDTRNELLDELRSIKGDVVAAARSPMARSSMATPDADAAADDDDADAVADADAPTPPARSRGSVSSISGGAPLSRSPCNRLMNQL